METESAKERRAYYMNKEVGQCIANNETFLRVLKENGFNARQSTFFEVEAYCCETSDSTPPIVHLCAEFAQPHGITDIVKNSTQRFMQKAKTFDGVLGVTRVRVLKDCYAYVSAITRATERNPQVFSLRVDEDIDNSDISSLMLADSYYSLFFNDVDGERFCDTDFFANLMPRVDTLHANAHLYWPHYFADGFGVDSTAILRAILRDHYLETMREAVQAISEKKD